jgi:hypothetical protein
MRVATRAFLLLAMSGTLFTACASSGSSNQRSRNSNTISATEMDQARREGMRDLYEVVERVRPRWLRVRTDPSFNLQTLVVVYQNESKLGGVDALRGYPLTSVNSLRYLDAAQAGLLPGAGGGVGAHLEGAIVINTAPGRY